MSCQPRYIGQAARRLRDEFDLDFPMAIDKLCSLPNVGSKSRFRAHIPHGKCASLPPAFFSVASSLGEKKCGHRHRRARAPHHLEPGQDGTSCARSAPTKRAGKNSEPIVLVLTDRSLRGHSIRSCLPTEFHKEIDHLLVDFGQVSHLGEVIDAVKL